MNKASVFTRMLVGLVFFESLGLAQDATLDTDSLRLMKGNWSIWEGQDTGEEFLRIYRCSGPRDPGGPLLQVVRSHT